MNYVLNIYKFGQFTGSEISQTQPQNLWVYGEEAPSLRESCPIPRRLNMTFFGRNTRKHKEMWNELVRYNM